MLSHTGMVLLRQLFLLYTDFICIFHQSIQIYKNSDITENGTPELYLLMLQILCFNGFLNAFQFRCIHSFFKFDPSLGNHEKVLLDIKFKVAVLVLDVAPKPDAVCGVRSCVSFAFASANNFSLLAAFFPPVISMQFFICPGILLSGIYYFVFIWNIYFAYVFFLGASLTATNSKFHGPVRNSSYPSKNTQILSKFP